MGLAARFASGGNDHYRGLAEFRKGKPQWTNDIRLYEHMLDKPIRWRKPRMIFVNSMSDLYHKDIPLEWIQKVFSVMESGRPPYLPDTYQAIRKACLAG